MKNLFLTLFLLLSFSVFSESQTNKDKSSPNKDTITYSKLITVHGMVCAFCANSIEKKFKTEEAVDQIKVDLANKKINLLFKKGKSIKDEKLKSIIASSGFKVVDIQSPADLK